MSKTDTGLNIIGQRMDDDPVPTIYVGPSESFVIKQMEPRLKRMIDESEGLAAKLKRGKDDTKKKKIISGVDLVLGYAGSATELASFAAALAVIDERDRMDSSVKGEGDPVELVETRGDTYPDFTMVIMSTPLVGNVDEEWDEFSSIFRWGVAEPELIQSPTWKLWQEGTRHEFAWPCPECGLYFVPRFNLLKWPEGASPAQAEREAYVCCHHCGGVIEEHQKAELNRRGVALAPGQKVVEGEVVGNPPETDTFSLWTSGLCSPFRTFGNRAARFLKAKNSGDIDRIQVAINTQFGELFKIGGAEAPSWQRLAELREPYSFGEVPNAVQKITCAVDVQKDRLIYAVRGWAHGWESWLLDAGEFVGATTLDDVWRDLKSFLAAGIGGRRFDMTLIDSGYRPGKPYAVPTNKVYEFCRDNSGMAVRPTKGASSKPDKPYRMAQIDVTLRGKTYKRGLELWHLDTDYFKSWVQSYANMEPPEDSDDTGYRFHFGHDATIEYCKALYSEVRQVLPSGAVKWVRVYKENHFLDCESMNVAAAHMIGVHRLQPKNEKRDTQAGGIGRRLAAMNG